ILNAPTDLMRDEGYGEGYIYDHDAEGGVSGQAYFPPEMPPETFYEPVERGFERDLKRRAAYFAKFRAGS
ncbi:MAG: replication-associated recombination protein A, partial [Pseudomonadota bacterium]